MKAPSLRRRRLLHLGASTAAGLVLPGCGLGRRGRTPPDPGTSATAGSPPSAPIPAAVPGSALPAEWAPGARIAGLTASEGQIDRQLDALNALAAQRVSVVELDLELSMYLTDRQFAANVELFDSLARMCHDRQMRAVAYYPALEVLTPDAATSPTMAKDHPEWVQLSLDGQPNVFVGGGHVFWVERGMESAWMCPSSGYVSYFAERVKALAQTALDGVWLDVPLLSEIVGVWPCANETCQHRFREETGLTAPTAVDWASPVFRRWVAWRHQLLWSFEQEILAAARSVRPDFAVITETVTMDYNTGTSQGLDGSLHDDGDLFRVWEVDAVSDATAMRGATSDDWLSMAAMMRYARGMSGARPSWIFCYGLQPDDAERVMSLAIATGNAPYETQIPRMCTTVGVEYRRQMFDWIEQHAHFYRSVSANPAAVLYSASSRDYLDRSKGDGLYSSLSPDDPLWWTTNEDDLAGALEYMGDYRGLCRALIQTHVPFDVISAGRMDRELLARFRLIVAPSPGSLSDQAIALLDGYVRGGGTLLLSGNDGGALDEYGGERGAPRLLQALELPARDGTFVRVQRGQGTLIHSGGRPGQEILRSGGAGPLASIAEAARGSGTALETDAPPGVLLDLRRAGPDGLLLFAANLECQPSNGAQAFSAVDVTFSLKLPLPAGRTAARVLACAPREPDQEVPFVVQAGQLVLPPLLVHSLLVLQIQLA